MHVFGSPVQHSCITGWSIVAHDLVAQANLCEYVFDSTSHYAHQF